MDSAAERAVISRILNHKQRGVTDIYDRYTYTQEKRDALEKWAQKIIGIVESECADVIPMIKY